MGHNDTKAAVGLLLHADFASLRTERVIFSAVRGFEVTLRAGLIEGCQCWIMVETLNKVELVYFSIHWYIKAGSGSKSSTF